MEDDEDVLDVLDEQDAPVFSGFSPRSIHLVDAALAQTRTRIVAPNARTITMTTTTATSVSSASTVTGAFAVATTTSASTTSEMDEDAEAMEQQSLLREEHSEQQQQRRAPSQQNRAERNSSGGDGSTSLGDGNGATQLNRTANELDWDVEGDGWMPKPARLHSGKTRSCAVCFAPLQYTTMQGWNDYLQSEEYLTRLQENLLDDTFISGLICGDSTGGDLPTEHRMHKNRKMKCMQSVHDYLNMVSAGVIDKSGKEKGSVRTLEEMLLNVLPTPVLTHMIERRLAVISHSSGIACKLLKENRVQKLARPVDASGSNIELHHLAIHTLSALLSSFDYNSQHAPQSFEEMSRLLTCFPVLSLYSFWSPKKKSPEKPLVLKSDMVEATSCSGNPRPHPADFAVDDADNTFWLSQQRPGLTHFVIRHPDVSRISSIQIQWHLKCFPQRVAIEYRVPGSDKFVQLAEEKTTVVQPPEYFSVRFPESCAEMRISMSGIPPINRNGTYAIKNIQLNVPCSNSLFVEPKSALNDVANWLLGAVQHRNEDVIIEAIGALKAWALSTASLSTTLLFVKMLLDFGKRCSFSADPGISRFAIEQGYMLYEGIKAYKLDESEKMLRGEGKKKNSESRKIRALFESSVCSVGVAIEDAGLTVRTRETSYQYAAVNTGILAGKASWKFRLDNDTVDDEMTCFGAAILPVTVSGYDSSPNLWMLRGYNGNLYARGHKLSRSIGKVHPGDVVQIEVDMTEGTMAYKINDTEYGVVFTDLAGHEVYPAVSFYGSGKVITLLGVQKWDDSDSGAADIDPVYLSNVKEYHYSVGYGTFGKGNQLGYASDSDARTIPAGTPAASNPVTINGEPRQRCLSTHPPSRGNSYVIYDLADAYNRLVGAVGINDDVQVEVLQQRGVSVVFSILGDGEALWHSKPTSEARQIEKFDLLVKGVRMLELMVTCSGSNHCAHAIWIDPCLYPLDEWMCTECTFTNKGAHKTCTVCRIGSRGTSTTDSTAMSPVVAQTPAACQANNPVTHKDDARSLERLMKSADPFLELSSVITSELHELSCLSAKREKLKLADGIARRASDYHGQGNQRGAVGFEAPFFRQPCGSAFALLLAMLRRFQSDLACQAVSESFSEAKTRAYHHSTQMCIHTLGIIGSNFESVDVYEVGDLQTEIEVTEELVRELRCELECIANIHDQSDCHLPKEVQLAASETMISGVSVIYSTSSDKLQLLLNLLRSHAVEAFRPGTSRFVLLVALMQILASPGKEGILNLFPFLMTTSSGGSAGADEASLHDVNETVRLLICVIQQSEWKQVSNESDDGDGVSIAKGALSLLKTYQVCLLAEAVGLTKKTRSTDENARENSSALFSSELNVKRSLVQESTVQYGFLLLRASREMIESLMSEQAEQSFVLSPEACSIQANTRTYEIPVLSELLPWFVSCLCLLRRQTWLARPVLPTLCRLLGSFDQYCSELQIVNKADRRLRKLELHLKARMIEAHEMERMVAVDKSLVVNHQVSKQMYNVFKQLYTGDKDHFEGQIGFQFEATSTFQIVALGRSVNPAKNNGRLIRHHTVRLWEEASQLLVAQVTVTGTSKKDSLGYALESLVAPVKLTQGKLYRLTTQEFANGGDPWYKKENLPDEEYDSSYIKILRDCYASGSTSFPNSQNLSGAAYGVPTFLVEGENPVASIPRFASPFGSLSMKFSVKKKPQSVYVSHSGTSVYGVGGGATWRSCFLQTAFVQGVHSVDFVLKSARVGGTVSGHICVGADWSMCSNTQSWVHPSSRFESFFGENLSSIGWMPSIGALWVKGKRSSYGRRFALVAGDILTLVVDYDLHTLSFAYNGKSVGVAVGLAELQPASSALPRLPDALTPGVSIYGSQDVVQVRPSGIAKSTLRVHWLFDLHNSLSSLAGRIASTLIAGHPVDGIEEELLPWLQSPLLSGGILGDTVAGHRDQRDSGQLDWQNALEHEYSQNTSKPAFQSVLLGVRDTSDSGSETTFKRAFGSNTMMNAEVSTIRQSKFFESLSQDMSDAGPAQVVVSWLEKRSPDRSFLSRLGKFPSCERLMCAALIKHAPPHVLHEAQAIVSGADPSQYEALDHSNLDPSEDLLLVWKRVVTLRHWLIKTRQEYRARSSDEAPVDSIGTGDFSEVSPQGDGVGDEGVDFEKRLSMPKTFDNFIEQVCQRAEFLCLLDPPSEERDKLHVDSQVALSNLAEKWSAQKTPPSLQPMLERWKSLRESDSSKWSGIVDVLRAQDRWRSRRASITHPPEVLSLEKQEVPSTKMNALGGQATLKRRYHYKDSFSATMKACDLYIRNGVGAPPEVLRMLLERRQKRSDSRLFGLQAMKSILSIISFDAARHNAIIFLRPALRGFTDDEKESRELNDVQVVTESFRATVRHHYLNGLEGCNRPTIERVQNAFCELYSSLAQLLGPNAGDRSPDSQFKHAILCAWCLDFEPRDHPFLLKTGILSTAHDLFSIQSSQVDAAADLAGMKVTANTYFDRSAARRSTMQYTTINWHPLSEEFVQQSVLHTGYVTKRDILRLLLRAPSYACTKQWWKESGLDLTSEDGQASTSLSRHTASSMALLYSELLKNLQTKLSWCRHQFLGQRALQFGMASSSAHSSPPPGQNAKPTDISFVETPALGEVQDFCVEMWVFPVELSGYRSLRSDNGFQDGSVYLEFVDQHLQLGISGNFPREQLFTSYRFQTHEWSHIALSYDVQKKSLALVVNGAQVEERVYERVCNSIQFRAGRIGCWVSEVDAHGVTPTTASIQRSYKGSITEIRMWGVPRTSEQIKRDYQRSIPFEIDTAPSSYDQPSRGRANSLLALWHLNEGEGLCGHDSAPSLSTNSSASIADQENLRKDASISSCHWALTNLPVVSSPSVDALSVFNWAKVMRGIIALQRKIRSLVHVHYQSAVVSSRLVCQYEEDQSTQHWSDFSDDNEGESAYGDEDSRIMSADGESSSMKELDLAAQQLIKEWSISTDQQILLKKQTKRCAWIVFRFLATIGVGGVIERREGEAKSLAAIAKMKRKQKLQKGDSISELGSPMHQRLASLGKLDAARAAGLSYDEEDQKARTIEAASDAAKSAATNRELEEPVLQTLWFSQEFHRKVFEVIERELVLGTTLIRDAEGLTRAQRMLRSISTPVERKGEALRSHTSGIEGKGISVLRTRQRLPSELSAQGELMETLEVEMYMFGLLSFMLSLSGSSAALQHLSKSKMLRELLDLLRTASPRSQRVVKLLLRRMCCDGVVTPANVSSLLGSESVLVDLLLDQVAESVCSTTASLPAHGGGAASSGVSGDSSSPASISESLSNPTGFRSGQIYLGLASESVALLRILLKERNWQARVAELLCSAIRNVAPVLTRRKSDSSFSKNAEPSDIRVRAAIVRAVGALCVLGSHSDCLRIGGRVEVTAKESRSDQTHLDYGFNFSDSGAGPAPATLIELNSRTSTVRVVFDASSEEFDPGHNVQEVNLSSLSPIEEIRLPSDVIPLTMDMMPVILKLSSLEESSIMSSFDDLWRMQVRSRALLALEAILRHSMHMAQDVAYKHITKSLLKSALSPVCLNTFVSLPFLQERGRMILCRLIESSTPLGTAMFRGLGDPKAPAIADAKADAASAGDASGDANDPEEEESEEYRVRRGFASTLAAMGFEFDLCMAALEHSRNDPNLAVEWLMGAGAAAYQDRQQAQRLASASLEAGQASETSEGGQPLTLEAKARELESISGMPYCLAFCALELMNSDPNRAMEWMMENGSRYVDKAGSLSLLGDDFVTEKALTLDDRAAMEDVDQPDPLVASSSISLAANPPATALVSSSSLLMNEVCDNSDIMAVTLAPILAPAVQKPSSKKGRAVARDLSSSGFAPLDPDYLTPYVLLSVSSQVGPLQSLSASGRTGLYRRCTQDQGVLITFLNTETGAYEDEWHFPQDVRRITKIYDEEIQNVGSIHRVALRTENALATHYARSAVAALLRAGAAGLNIPAIQSETARNQQRVSLSDTILNAVGGPRQFVNLLKLVAASEMAFSRGNNVTQVKVSATEKQARFRSKNGDKRLDRSVIREETGSILQSIQEITLEVLEEEARSGKVQHADWLWYGEPRASHSARAGLLKEGSAVASSELDESSLEGLTRRMLLDEYGEIDEDLYRAIAMSVQDSGTLSSASSARLQSQMEETKKDSEERDFVRLPPQHNAIVMRTRQPSYAEAQEVADKYLGGGVDDHDGLLSSVLVKECVSHFVESTLVARQGLSNDKSAQDPRLSTQEFHSLHPYFGRCEYTRAVAVDRSFRCVRVVFDHRCKLGAKAKLSFYSDAECENRILSVDSTMTAGGKRIPDLVVHSHQFWFRFNATEDDPVKNHGYGFRFQVKPMPSICWSKEEEVLVNPSLEWACWILEFLLSDATELVARGAVHNRKIYGALVRYLRSPGAPFKSRVVRLLLQLLHKPELFPASEIPDLEALESIGELALTRSRTEKESGKTFISAHLLQLVELSMMTSSAAKVFELSGSVDDCTQQTVIRDPLLLPTPADQRATSETLSDVSELTNFLLGNSSTLPQHVLVAIWLDTYGSTGIIESPHPYTSQSKLSGRFDFAGAQSLLVTFDSRCATGSDAAFLELSDSAANESVHVDDREVTIKRYSGSRHWPSGAVDFSSDAIRYKFVGDENPDGLYGVSLSVTAVGLSKEKQLARASVRDIATLLEKLVASHAPARDDKISEPDQAKSTVWTSAMDLQLVDWVNINVENAASATLSSVDLRPSDVRLHPTLDGLRCSLLLDLSIDDVQLRFSLLKYFNQALKECLPLLDLRDTTSSWTIAHRLRLLSHCVFFDIKNALVEAAIETTGLSGDAASNNANTARITLDRLQALESRDDREVEPSVSECFFAQAFRQLNCVDPTLFRRKIDSKGRLFSVKFRGEEGVDWGGVYREGANSMVDDLFSAHFSLFVLCPNGQHDTGINRGMYLSNPKCTSPVAIQMYEFVGKLLGISLRTHGDFPFMFPSLVWKQLLHAPLEQSDLEGTDAMFVQMLDGIRSCERDGIVTEEEFDVAFEGLDLKFTAFDCNGQEAELVDGGKGMRVTFQNRLEYCRLAEQYRLHEGALQVAAMARGFALVFPMRALTLLTWQEMEILTCGSPKIDIALWKQHTRYDGYSEGDETVTLFWEAMESFSDEQRSDFVRFAWGRSRLPRGKWPQPFKLTKKGGRDSTLSLPVAHTCFFSVELPPYTTTDKMRSMLLATINFGLGGILMA